MEGKLKLYGFNNLTKSLSFNIYDVCYAKSAREQKDYIAYIDEQYNSERLTKILFHVTEMIGAHVLNVSKQDYEPQGASVNVLIAEDNILTEDIDALHVTPFHSYPSGVTTSISKRYEYLKWAENTGNYIIEDDFDSEFFIPGHPIESLYSLDHFNHVIYINTFSKSLSPAMRIGYMILPDALLEKYDQVLGNLSCSVPVMDQYILAEFISSGNFERHLNHMRRKMKK